uniref:Uncharacterized protein n=1 Tax=Anguilla anguilla TaxID=7936 RepID=A0A0E9QBR8_ANGAN
MVHATCLANQGSNLHKHLLPLYHNLVNDFSSFSPLSSHYTT